MLFGLANAMTAIRRGRWLEATRNSLAGLCKDWLPCPDQLLEYELLRRVPLFLAKESARANISPCRDRTTGTSSAICVAFSSRNVPRRADHRHIATIALPSIPQRVGQR